MKTSKGKPLRDGGGKGRQANCGRGGCKVPQRPNQRVGRGIGRGRQR